MFLFWFPGPRIEQCTAVIFALARNIAAESRSVQRQHFRMNFIHTEVDDDTPKTTNETYQNFPKIFSNKKIGQHLFAKIKVERDSLAECCANDFNPVCGRNSVSLDRLKNLVLKIAFVLSLENVSVAIVGCGELGRTAVKWLFRKPEGNWFEGIALCKSIWRIDNDLEKNRIWKIFWKSFSVHKFSNSIRRLCRGNRSVTRNYS